MYAGHEDLGWEFIEKSWPAGQPGCKALCKELKVLMAQSPYWADIRDAGGE